MAPAYPITIRAHGNAPRARLALPGDTAYLSWFSEGTPWDGSPYVAFTADAPGKVLAKASVLDVDGALVVRRSFAEKALGRWVADGLVALRPVVVAPIKEPARPRFDKKPLDSDFCIFDPTVEVAADRTVLGESCFRWWQGPPQAAASVPRPASMERALLISYDAVPFGDDTIPPEAIFRVHDLPLDVWVVPAVMRALKRVFAEGIVEGRTRPSPPFVAQATGFVPLPGTDKDADAAAAAFFAAMREGRLASPRGPGKIPTAERSRILASPRYAELLARREGPSEASRAAALRHPYYAYLYARDVDRGPRDDTRAAAAEIVDTAILYAIDVDQASHPITRARLLGTYRLDEYEERLARLSARRAAAPLALEKLGLTPTKQARDVPAPTLKAVSSASALTAATEFEVVVLKAPAEGEAYVPSAPEDSIEWGLAVGDGDVIVEIPDTKPGAKLAKSIAACDALGGSPTSPWVLRRELAEAMFAGTNGVKLRAARAKFKGKVLAADLVYVDVVEDRPLDRETSSATYSDPGRLWSSVVRAITTAKVVSLPSDAFALCRVTEFPSLILASAPLIHRWKKLKAPVRVVEPPHAHLRPLPVFPLWDEGPPFPQVPDSVSSAKLRAALGGDATARQIAVRHPGFAYAIARLADREPRTDTRAGAIGHPDTAALYARFVDGAPRADTRTASLGRAPAALFYARYVDCDLVAETRQALADRGQFRPGDFAKLEKRLAAFRKSSGRKDG